MAANNLFRCLLGARAIAAAVPLIERIGMGWVCTFVAGIWLTFSSMLWAVFNLGYGWRENKRLKEKADEISGTGRDTQLKGEEREGKD